MKSPVPVKLTKGFLSLEEQVSLRRAIEDGPWDTLTIPQYDIEVKRTTATYYEGNEKAANSYMNKFGGKGIQARPFAEAPAELNMVRDALKKRYGYPFSLCYINNYKDETTQIGWHRDREEESSPYPLVMLCLGGARVFSIWKIRDNPEVLPTQDWDVLTESGDLVEMPVGFHNKDAYKHAVLPQKEFAAPRYSFTFRNPDLSVSGLWVPRPRAWDCHAGKQYPADAVYVGCTVRDRKGKIIRQGSIFGNGTNPLVSHRGWLKTEKEFRAYAEKKMQDATFREQTIKDLRGKDLLCWCIQEGPKRDKFCHARVWLELVNA